MFLMAELKPPTMPAGEMCESSSTQQGKAHSLPHKIHPTFGFHPPIVGMRGIWENILFQQTEKLVSCCGWMKSRCGGEWHKPAEPQKCRGAVALLPLLEKDVVKELQWGSGPMSCSRGYIARKGKRKHQWNSVDLWWREGQGCGRNGAIWQTEVRISSRA